MWPTTLGNVTWPLKRIAQKHLFRTFQSPGLWPIEYRVIARFFQTLGSLGSLTATLIGYSLVGSVGSPKFVCLGINFSKNWINRSPLIHFSKQIALNKCQAYRMKFLSLTLGFYYCWQYFTISNLVRFSYRFSWKS